MKIDTSLIEGFDTMTPEQRVEALQNFDLDPTKAGFRTQADFDRVSSESAERKRRIKELEQAGDNTDLTKRLEELEAANKALVRENLIASNASRFTAMGYSADLAQEAAVASADGDQTKLFEIQAKFLEAHDKALKAQALKDMKGLQHGGDNPKSEDADLELARKFGKMTADANKAASDVLSHYIK